MRKATIDDARKQSCFQDPKIHQAKAKGGGDLSHLLFTLRKVGIRNTLGERGLLGGEKID